MLAPNGVHHLELLDHPDCEAVSRGGIENLEIVTFIEGDVHASHGPRADGAIYLTTT